MNTAKILPFNFESKEVRTLLIDGQPWFVAMDISGALGYTDAQAMTRRLDDDEIQNRQVVGLGNRGVTLVNESGLYSAILRSRKAEAKRFKKWVTAEVLPTIRKHGFYADENNSLNTLVGQTIGTDGFRCLAAVLDGKVRHLPKADSRRIKSHVWSQVHKAFSVVSAQNIPANKIDSVRNFIAAYAIEGELLERDKKEYTLNEQQAYDVLCLLHSVSWVKHRWEQGISKGVEAINPKLHGATFEHVSNMDYYGRKLDASLKEFRGDFDNLRAARPDEDHLLFAHGLR